MDVYLPYGTSKLSVNIPKTVVAEVGHIAHPKEITDVNGEILQYLRSPAGASGLASLVKGGDKVAIIIDDNTRPCPDKILLPPILEELKRGGVDKEEISIIVATGLHPAAPEKLEEMVGAEILEEHSVVFHDAESPEMVSFGETSRGIPIRINRLVAEADFKISTGFIEPHFFAGFSGGRKSIMPGVSAEESIRENHGYAMLEDPNARAGVLGGNPVYEDSVEHARAVGHNFIVNVILDKDKKIGKIFAGDWMKAYIKGAEAAYEIFRTKFKQKMDITITSNYGYPLDSDLYQTVKGITTASSITKKGGCIIAVAQCERGVGPDNFWKLHKETGSPDKVLAAIKNKEFVGVQWQNQMLARVQLAQEIYLISELQDCVVEDFMIKPADSVETALAEAMEKFGKNAHVAILPEGPATLPIVEERFRT